MSSKYIVYKGSTYKMVDAGDDKTTWPADEVYDFEEIRKYCDGLISRIKDRVESSKKALAEAQKIKQKLLSDRKLPAKQFYKYVLHDAGNSLRALKSDYNSSDSNLDFEGYQMLTRVSKARF